jgi:hypothetical protein
MCGEALAPFATALPPDVRRGYAAAGSLGEKEKGLSPRYGLWPKMIGLSPYQGHSPLGKLEVSGEA